MSANAIAIAELQEDASMDGYFSAEFQTRLLSLFVRDERICSSLINHIRPQQFSEMYQGAYLRDVVAWIQHWHTTQTGLLPRYVFDQWSEAWVAEQRQNQDHHKATWCYLAYHLYDAPLPEADFLKEEFFSWYAAVEERLLLVEAKNHVGQGGSLGDLDMLERLRQIGQAEQSAKEPAMMLGTGDPDEVSRFMNAPARDVIESGIEALDAAAKGGLGRKELWSILAPPNTGKTTTLCALSSRYVERGNFVVYFSFEQSKEQLYEKHLCSLSKNTPEQLRDHPDVTAAWSTHIHSQGGLLAIQEYPTGTGTMADMKASVRQLETKYGRQADVVIIDYIDDIQLDKTVDQLRHQLKAAYVQFRGWAFEHNFLALTASQVNRDAAEKETFGIAGLAESYGKAAVADGMIALCQTEQEQAMGIMRWFLAKNRIGPRYVTITMTVDFALSVLTERLSAVSSVGAVPTSASSLAVHGGGMDTTAAPVLAAQYAGLPVPMPAGPTVQALPAPGLVA